MRISTRVEWDWRDGRYVKVAEEGYDYDGPLALCTGAEEVAAPAAAEGAKGAADAAPLVGGATSELAPVASGLVDASGVALPAALGGAAGATAIQPADSGGSKSPSSAAPVASTPSTASADSAGGKTPAQTLSAGNPTEASLGELGINTALPVGAPGGPATAGFIPSTDVAGTAAANAATQGATTAATEAAGAAPLSAAGPQPASLQAPAGSPAASSAPTAPAVTSAPTAAVPPPTTVAPPATSLPVGGASASPEAPLAPATGPAAPPTVPAGTEAGTAAKTAAETAGAQSGITKALTKLGILTDKGNLGANVLPLAGVLGSQALTAKSSKALPAQLSAVAKPASTAADKLISEGLSGQAPPAVVQQFDQSLKEKTAEITARYANMGRDAATDSAAQAEIQKAKDARDAGIANYSAGLTSQGLTAAGVAAGPATSAALAGAQQDKELAAAMSGSLQNMALLQALQSGQRVPPG